MSIFPVHASVVPFPQSILIGVVAVASFALHVKFISYPLVVLTGADHVIPAQPALVSAVLVELHDCPVITHPRGLGYW